MRVVDSNRFPTEDLHYLITSLPNEILGKIVQQLSLEDLLRCSEVSTRWFNIVSELLLRTQSCALITDQVSCNGFNTNEKVIRQLILRNVDLWHCFRTEKFEPLESFYLDCSRCTGDDMRSMGSLLRQCKNLTRLMIHTRSPLEILHLEELLCHLKYIKTICLIVDTIDEKFKKVLIEFFDSSYFFYDEIVIQVLNPRNEIIYVCSNKVTMNPHLNSHYSKVSLSHVGPSVLKSLLSHSSTQIKHLEIDGTENSADEAFSAIANTSKLEYLFLRSFSNTNQALGRLFKNLASSATLKELSISNCSNITDEEMAELEHLSLNSLHIDFRNCPKISIEERFLNYCLRHVHSLRICFIYNENILNNFLNVLEKSYYEPPVTKEIHMDILRVNHCSKEVSDHMEDFKSSIENLVSIHVNVAEIFTRFK